MDYVGEIITGLITALGTGLLLYVTSMVRIARLEGKMDALVNLLQKAEMNEKEIGALGSQLDKLKYDMNGVYERVRRLEDDPPKTIS